MVKLPSIRDKNVEVEGKTVIVRTGMDAPLDDNGTVMDDTRINEAIPTIQHLVKKGARVVLLTHIDRPGGKVVESQRVASTAARLSELMEQEVKPLPDCIGADVEAAVKQMKGGDVVFLENLRFHPEEEANDDDFAEQLAKLGEPRKREGGPKNEPTSYYDSILALGTDSVKTLLGKYGSLMDMDFTGRPALFDFYIKAA